jgi:uncharacterized protein (DUF736 family)
VTSNISDISDLGNIVDLEIELTADKSRSEEDKKYIEVPVNPDDDYTAIWSETEQETRDYLRERLSSPCVEFNKRNKNSTIDIGEKEHLHIINKFQVVPKRIKGYNPLTKPKTGSVKKPLPTNYRRVTKDLHHIQSHSLETSYHTRRYSDILRNQLIRAHSHLILEIALKFEEFRKRNIHNKDPTWFLEKVAGDLFIFTDELQGVSNLPESDRRITSIDFEEIAEPANLGPFIGFQDPRHIIKNFSDRITI